MKEIEVKILNINKKHLEKELRRIGAKKVDTITMEVVVFDTPDMRIKKSKRLLRLRTENNRNVLTFKEKSAKTLVRSAHEYELTVSDFTMMKLIFEKLGFTKLRKYTKQRTTYKLGKAEIEIDEYPEIPPLLEIEAPSLKEIRKVVLALGYTMKDTTTMTGWGVFKYYGKKLGE